MITERTCFEYILRFEPAFEKPLVKHLRNGEQKRTYIPRCQNFLILLSRIYYMESIPYRSSGLSVLISSHLKQPN